MTILAQIEQASLPDPEREFRFDHERRWRFDLAWPEYKVALEIEGGVWMRRGATRCPACGEVPRGRHLTGRGYENDCIKYSNAAIAGWCVIRATSDMINKTTTALQLVTKALEARGWTTTANLPPKTTGSTTASA